MADDAWSDVDRNQQAELRRLKNLGKVVGRYSRKEPSREPDIFRGGKGDHTDVVVKCGRRKWNAHRTILTSRCKFFRACLELNCEESRSNIIELHDEDPDVCRIFLDYLYNRTVRIFEITSDSDQAEGYQCNSEKVYKTVTPDTIVGLCKMSDKYDQPALLELIADFLRTFPRFKDFPFGSIDQTDALVWILVELEKLGKSARIALIQDIMITGIFHMGKVAQVLSNNSVYTLCRNGRVLYKMLLVMSETPHKESPQCKDCESEICVWHDEDYCGSCLHAKMIF